VSTPSLAGLSGATYLRLVLLGALIGIPAALVAALFLVMVHQGENLLWDDLPRWLGYDAPPWFLVVGLPVLGGLLVLAVRRLLPGDGGHSPLKGIGGGATPVSYAPGIALAALATLAFGEVLGPEAPLIALGSAVGVAVTHLVRLQPREIEVLGTAGSFSAVSALFGGPLVAGMLLLEGAVGLGTAAVPVLLPGLVAAAVGYVLFVGIGGWGGLDTTSLQIPDLPAYDGTHLLDLGLAVVIGVLLALTMQAVRTVATALSARDRTGGTPLLLVGGGLVVGLLALGADLLGADSQDVLFSGQTAIPLIVGETSAGVLVVVFLAKALAYAVCLGAGFRGGPVFPAVFLGIGLAMLTVVWFDVSPTLAVAVGAAAGMTAGTRLVFSSLLLALLLVGGGGLDAAPAAVLAVAAAWITTAALARRS
jgi:chloride channel protein, CIC family